MAELSMSAASLAWVGKIKKLESGMGQVDRSTLLLAGSSEKKTVLKRRGSFEAEPMFQVVAKLVKPMGIVVIPAKWH